MFFPGGRNLWGQIFCRAASRFCAVEKQLCCKAVSLRAHMQRLCSEVLPVSVLGSIVWYMKGDVSRVAEATIIRMCELIMHVSCPSDEPWLERYFRTWSAARDMVFQTCRISRHGDRGEHGYRGTVLVLPGCRLDCGAHVEVALGRGSGRPQYSCQGSPGPVRATSTWTSPTVLAEPVGLRYVRKLA